MLILHIFSQYQCGETVWPNLIVSSCQPNLITIGEGLEQCRGSAFLSHTMGTVLCTPKGCHYHYRTLLFFSEVIVLNMWHVAAHHTRISGESWVNWTNKPGVIEFGLLGYWEIWLKWLQKVRNLIVITSSWQFILVEVLFWEFVWWLDRQTTAAAIF
jgi:hypothetical protein